MAIPTNAASRSGLSSKATFRALARIFSKSAADSVHHTINGPIRVSDVVRPENPPVVALLNQFFNRRGVNAAQHWQASSQGLVHHNAPSLG